MRYGLPLFFFLLFALPLSASAAACTESGCGVDRVPILMYHHVRIDTNTRDRLGVRLSVAPKLFRDQLDALAKQGFTTIRFTDLKDGKATAKKPVILTFDDGYDDMVTNALPELKAHRMLGVFFIITGKIDTPGYLTHDQIKLLKANGMEIAAHTVTHPNLARMTEAAQRHEIVDSINELRSRFSVPVVSFAYPIGRYNSVSRSILKKTGLRYAVTTHHGVGDFRGDTLLLKRIRVMNTTDGKRLLKMIDDVL